METQKIISLDISKITYRDALDEIISLAKSQRPAYACFANAHMTIEAHNDPQFAKCVNQANYVFADGMPLCVATGFLYGKQQERVAGMDFTPSVIGRCHEEGLSIVFFGSTEEVLNKIRARMETEYPNAKITTLSPPFGSLESHGDIYIDKIKEAEPHIVFVALGCPKQEKWMAKNYQKINAVSLGVGAAFPIFAQTMAKAPEWMRRSSIEWIYRLFQEPRRLWKRYLFTNTKFLALIFKQKLFGK